MKHQSNSKLKKDKKKEKEKNDFMQKMVGAFTRLLPYYYIVIVMHDISVCLLLCHPPLFICMKWKVMFYLEIICFLVLTSFETTGGYMDSAGSNSFLSQGQNEMGIILYRVAK